MAESRRDELHGRLDTVTSRIRDACQRTGRDPREVTLVVVTKTWPSSDLRILYDLGVRDVGENRQQELEQKAALLDDLDLRWHFVGQIQSKKAARVTQYASVVHSVDSERLVGKLDAGAQRAGRVLDCLVQVSLDPDEAGAGRGGADVDRADAVAQAVDGATALRLRGVMAVAPLGADPAPAYARLAGLAASMRERHPDADWISAGMSNDLEAAVEAGATHVRVGSAVLGERPPLR